MRRLCPRAQRGVIALMAVLFLLFMLSVVLMLAHQMSATDVYDSGAQNLSVEALFLAESGIERASVRYRDNGALCAANGLAEAPSFTIVPGSNRQFRIVSSAGNTTTCTVDARGEIGDIQRQVQVILRRTAGGGVIVDPGFDNPGLWPSGGRNAVIAGGVAIFTNPLGPVIRDQLRASPPAAVDTSGFMPNVNVAMAVSFTYTVVGTVNIRVRVQIPGPNPQVTLSNLTGSGTITLAALGTFDPTDITRIDVDILNFQTNESVVVDNFYVGPAAGGAAAVAVTSWTQVVP